MTFKHDNFARGTTPIFAAALLLAAAAAFTAASLSAEATSEDLSANQVFELGH